LIEVLEIHPLTEDLDRIGLEDGHKALVVQVAGYVRQILNYLPRAIPDYTDHGVQHSNNLIRIFRNFLRNLQCFDLSLSEEEKWLVCLAIWLHDVGCLVTKEQEKEKHNLYSVEILQRPEFHMLVDILGGDIVKCLKFVTKY